MIPPLARSTWPLIQPPSGPARNATALAMSCGLAEPLQRRELGEVVDHLLRLAVEEQLGRGRPRRDGVDGDVAAAQLLGQDMGHRLDARLGRGVDAVGRVKQSGLTLDDMLMMRPPSRSRFAASRRVLKVPFRLIATWRSNSCVVAFGDRRQLHDAGVVHQHVDAAERRLRRVEHARDRGRVADVGLRRDGAAAGFLDLR